MVQRTMYNTTLLITTIIYYVYCFQNREGKGGSPMDGGRTDA